VQIFCANFPSHLDLSGERSRRLPKIAWPEEFENNIELKISRYSLETFQVVLDDSRDHLGLAAAVLEFYAPSPIEKFCRADLIADALIKSKLFDMELAALTGNVRTSVKFWLDRAEERSRKLLPGRGASKGRVTWDLVDPAGMPLGGVRWIQTDSIA
jgi:hypothetical protein